MQKSLLILFFLTIITLISCRNDFTFEPNTGGLEFSKQTVYLDTVFTNIGSSTYRLKVYNRSNKDVFIPQVNLQKGLSSKFRMQIDGRTGNGKTFENVEILAKDSLFIFIETTADVASANPTTLLYTDKIEFHNIVSAPQTVDLVTLVQDAYFIYPQRTGSAGSYTFENINLGVDANSTPINYIGSNLSHTDGVNGDELHLTNSKPYVIYGYALVPNNETLIVDAGAKVYFHANSGIIVPRTGSIQINGTNPPASNLLSLVNEVTFEGDRLEPDFEDVPGQWGAIVSYSETNNNLINHLTLKNATVGILTQPRLISDNYAPKMTITNSKIFNCSNIGILARNSTLDGKNVVTNYCGESSLACTLGGNYNFTHCTFNNNWNSSRQVSVLLNNYINTSPTTVVVNPLSSANFNNCIIYGSNQVELLLDKKAAAGFNYKFTNCLIKFNSSQLNGTALYDFTNSSASTNYSNCFIAENSTNYNPKFVNTSKNKLWLMENLALQNAPGFSNFNDILGKSRSVVTPITTSLGAYQYVP